MKVAEYFREIFHSYLWDLGVYSKLFADYTVIGQQPLATMEIVTIHHDAVCTIVFYETHFTICKCTRLPGMNKQSFSYDNPLGTKRIDEIAKQVLKMNKRLRTS